MKMRRMLCVLSTALMVGSMTLTASPAVFAKDAPAAAAQEQKPPFDEQAVVQQMLTTISLFEKGDAQGLQAEATQELRPHLTQEQIDGAKAEIAKVWGARVSAGTLSMTATQTDGAWVVICELPVGYEGTAVVYRISYDANMKLAGLFIR